jgi:hypothetical protein
VKTMLMVAAGVVAGLTMVIAVAIAVLIQVLERLLPLLLVVALVVIVLWLVRRRPGQQAVHPYQAYPAYPVAPTSVAVLPPAPAALPVAANDHAATYLRWGPPRYEDLDAPVAITGASHGRRP